MFADQRHRVVSYHDTWISLDPIYGCPYRCSYCVLRHSGHTGAMPQRTVSPEDCVAQLIEYPLFVRSRTPLAIGNETDMLHPRNTDYLLGLLAAIRAAGLDNPITLITKAPLAATILKNIYATLGNQIVFFLSYSGLGQAYEPNFTDQQLRGNFHLAKAHGFHVVHYWRPLLPANTNLEAIRQMLSFVSKVADATVFVGLKLHPELTRIINKDALFALPPSLRNRHGEWLPDETADRIYREAQKLCPDYPLYRHASCALAKVRVRQNHTATVFRADICMPSHCPESQRAICQNARRLPSATEISNATTALGRTLQFTCESNHIVIQEEVTQEEFSFLLHTLNYPLRAKGVHMNNLYHGDIFKGQKTFS